MLTTLLAAALLHTPLPAAPAEPPRVTLTLSPRVQPGPYTGRVYLVMTRGDRDPRSTMTDWFSPPQVFSLDVAAVAPGAPIDLSSPAFCFPKSMADLPGGTYTVQGIARRSRDHYAPGQGEGDLYSGTAEVTWPPAAPLALTLDKAVPAQRVRESRTFKVFSMKSRLLSEFHGRDVTLRAGVSLPEGWSERSTQTWPAVYFITGFGGDHHHGAMFADGDADSPMRRVLTITPDPTNYWGHSVFADSAVTGPWGRALVEELIPAVEKQFHGPAGAGAPPREAAARRFVTGISSGGWSSLWLQVTYPDAFGGCWSHSPDPVNFHAFQTADLSAPGVNIYTLPDGGERPVARSGDRNILFYRGFVAMESALGPGGQIQSFEAVFSPRLPDGGPRPLFDRATGAVDPLTVKAWEPYDIDLVLRRNWKTLGPKLAGKLHVYAGDEDQFFLGPAVSLLKQTLNELDPQNTARADVQIIEGMGHAIHMPAQSQMFKQAAATAPTLEPAGAK